MLNLATPDIKGFFDIEAFNTEGFFDIEAFNFEGFFDIEAHFVYRALDQRYHILKILTFDIEVLAMDI
jgi:hypothetical protein